MVAMSESASGDRTAGVHSLRSVFTTRRFLPPFVTSTDEEIERALADHRAGVLDRGRPFPPALLRQLRGEQVHLLDLRRLREELPRLRHQRGGDGAVEVRLPAGVVRERVEDRRTPSSRDGARTTRWWPASACASGSALERNAATSSSLPGLATRRTSNATLTMGHLCERRHRPSTSEALGIGGRDRVSGGNDNDG